MKTTTRKLFVLLALAAMSIGVAACGSSSSSSTNSSNEPAAEKTIAQDVIKEAGVYKHVQLTVKNVTPEKDDPDFGPWFYLCFTLPSKCGDGANGIKPDPARVSDAEAVAKAPGSADSDTATSPDTTGSGGDVTGELGYPPGYSYWTFRAHNPVAARPTIALQSWTTIERACPLGAPCPTDAHGEWALDEPSAGSKTEINVTLAGSNFTLVRWPDTSDAIVLVIVARGVR